MLVGRIDPDAVPLGEVTDLWAALDTIERRAASTKLLLARRVEEAGRWKRDGYRGAAEQLAAIAGTSVTAARNQLETSKRVRQLPATEQALPAGKLSGAKAEAIAAAAEVAPEAEADLLEGAEDAPLADIKERCLRARAKDRDAAHARIRKARSLKEFTDAEGGWNVVVRGPVESGAAPAKTKPPAAGPVGIIRIDHTALRRGCIEGDEVCEIVGLGPIPVPVGRDLLGDAILKLVITQGVDVANVTHLGRSATVAQQVALWWKSAACTVLGCTRTRQLQNDHRYEWVKTKRTRVDELDPLCKHHHDLKTRNNWALVEGEGPRPMVAPDDPRHPNYGPPP